MQQTQEPIVMDDRAIRVVANPPGTAVTLIDRILQGVMDVDQIAERFEKIPMILEKIRLGAIRATYPSDWLIHTSTDTDGNVIRQVAYLQDCGADRAGKVFGIEIDEPIVEIVQTPEEGPGTYMVRMTADGWSNVTGERALGAVGSRWSGDKFFMKGLKEGEKPNPTNVYKAAYANLHGSVVRRLAGLKQVPIEGLALAGIDVSKVVHINYNRGARGGESTGAQVGSADFKITYGNCKGKTLAELSERDLEWYRKSYEGQLADPEKERFKANNERGLKAITGEIERRAQAKDQKSETGTASRSDRLTEQYKRLQAAATNESVSIGEATKRIFKEIGSTAKKFSEVTDEQLAAIENMEDEALGIVVAGVTE